LSIIHLIVITLLQGALPTWGIIAIEQMYVTWMVALVTLGYACFGMPVPMFSIVYDLRWMFTFGYQIIVFSLQLVAVGRFFGLGAVRFLKTNSIDRVFFPNGYQFALSTYLHNHSVGHTPDTIRRAFRNTPIPKANPQESHSHPLSAAMRAVGRIFSANVIASSGRTPYFSQMSKSDQDRGARGDRTMYWGKDVSAEPRRDPLLATDVPIHVHVDYYQEMPELLYKDPRPRMLVTLSPTTAGDTLENYSYHFDGKELVYKSTGGANFKHELWNYGSDHFTVRGWNGWSPTCTVYLVERRNIGTNDAVVLLAPIRTYTGFAAYLESFLSTEKLSKFDPSRKIWNGKEWENYTVFDVVKNTSSTTTEHLRTVGQSGAYSSLTMPVKEFDRLHNATSLFAGKVSPSTVKQFTGKNVNAELLTNYIRAAARSYGQPPVVYPVTHGVRHYTYAGPDLQDSKTKLKPFMCPLVPGAFAPLDTRENEQAGVDGRIKDVKPPHIEPSGHQMQTLVEFVEFIAATVGRRSLFPVDSAEVSRRQPRATQQRILAEAEMCIESERFVKSFVKAEAYQGPNDPRLISTVGPFDKLEYSRYIYAFSDAFKFSWYAFGKTPVDIAARVADICQEADTVVNTDLSRFDGRVSNLLRELEKMVVLACFDESCHAGLIAAMESQLSCRAVTRLGVKYDTGQSRLSGSPETSVFNTLANAYMAYLALRTLGQDPATAYEGLGIYGGDDGLTAWPAEAPVSTYVAAVASVGQKLTVDQTVRHDVGVNFLSRFYGPDVWTGSPNSMCDFYRQAAKFHTSHNLPSNVSPLTKLVEKCRSLALTDGNTPILGFFALRVLQLTNCWNAPRVGAAYEKIADLRLASWWAQYEESVQFPNEEQPWMMDLIQQQFEDKEINFDPEAFVKYVCAQTDPLKLLECPVISDKPYPVPRNNVMEAEVPEEMDSYPIPAPQQRYQHICTFSKAPYMMTLLPDAPRKKYSKSPRISHVPISGQRKLLVGEIQFLTGVAEHIDTVVYVGASSKCSRSHIPTLCKLFPKLHFVLIDPELDDSYINPQISIICEKVTPENFSSLLAPLALTGQTALISDIRSCVGDYPTASEISADNQLQVALVDILRPAHSSLKFCLPWTKGVTRFFDAPLILQPWNAPTSTETRMYLIGRPPKRNWDHTVYEEQMCHWNQGAASSAAVKFHPSPQPAPYCDCFSCTDEVDTLEYYLGSLTGADDETDSPLTMDLATLSGLVDEGSEALSTLTRKAHSRAEKRENAQPTTPKTKTSPPASAPVTPRQGKRARRNTKGKKPLRQKKKNPKAGET